MEQTQTARKNKLKNKQTETQRKDIFPPTWNNQTKQRENFPPFLSLLTRKRQMVFSLLKSKHTLTLNQNPDNTFQKYLAKCPLGKTRNPNKGNKITYTLSKTPLT